MTACLEQMKRVRLCVNLTEPGTAGVSEDKVLPKDNPRTRPCGTLCDARPLRIPGAN